MAWTRELLMAQLERSDRSVTWSLVRLWERELPEIRDDPFLSSLALQVIWRHREIERGDRNANCPLLSRKQLALARQKLLGHWDVLLEIANERHPEKAAKAASDYRIAEGEEAHSAPELPKCSRCGEEAQSAYGTTPFCGHCLHAHLRERELAPPDLMEEERERLHEELALLKSGGCRPERVETEALVIQGNRIRFKTPREFAAQYAEERNGMPRQLAAALAETNMKHNEDMSSAELFSADDPFDFDEE